MQSVRIIYCFICNFLQAKCLEAQCVDTAPETLWWLTRRQLTLLQALRSTPPERVHIVEERLDGFREVESHIVDMLTSVVEGGAEEMVEKTIIALRKGLIPKLGDGVDVLVGCVPPPHYLGTWYSDRIIASMTAFPCILHQRPHVRLARHFCAVHAVADMLISVCLTDRCLRYAGI